MANDIILDNKCEVLVTKPILLDNKDGSVISLGDILNIYIDHNTPLTTGVIHSLEPYGDHDVFINGSRVSKLKELLEVAFYNRVTVTFIGHDSDGWTRLISSITRGRLPEGETTHTNIMVKSPMFYGAKAKDTTTHEEYFILTKAEDNLPNGDVRLNQYIGDNAMDVLLLAAWAIKNQKQ